MQIKEEKYVTNYMESGIQTKSGTIITSPSSYPHIYLPLNKKKDSFVHIC